VRCRVSTGWSVSGPPSFWRREPAGYYHYTFPGPRDSWPGCVFITDPVEVPFDVSRPIAILAERFKTPVVKLTLTAHLTSSRFALSQAARVSGNVIPMLSGSLGPLHLQRRLADGAWVTVASVQADDISGAYWFRVAPPSRGTFAYRVYQPGCCNSNVIGTMSSTFSLTVY
jgi:hypothetical protein